MKKYVKITPIEPMMSRDGRPFDLTPGITAQTLIDFSPSMVAGTIRTIYYKQLQKNAQLSPNRISEKVKKLLVKGPFYEHSGKRYYPLPEDMYLYEDGANNVGACRLIPENPQKDLQDGAGFLGVGRKSLFEEQLWPVHLPKNTKKIKKRPAYISEELFIQLLTEYSVGVLEKKLTQEVGEWLQGEKSANFLQAFPIETRHHTSIESKTRVAKEGQLFSTQYIAVPEEFSLIAEVSSRDGEEGIEVNFSSIHSMGGEKRLAYFEEISDGVLDDCPNRVIQALDKAQYIRMVLATPAYFSKGWRPSWIDENLQTNDRWTYPVDLQLVWACIPDWQPFSGWSYSRGEKAIRRMVPAGSVYFFKVTGGNARELSKAWLQTVSDVDRRKGSFDHEDGFGLALWGVWQPDNTNNYKSLEER